MKNAIVITSIFQPTEAVVAFSQMPDYQLIVVGDKKTPENWHCENVRYLSLPEQEKMDFRLAKILPVNHYCRKMLGYLEAMQGGASCIVDTDDDNLPKKNWHFPAWEGQYERLTGNMGFVNIYQLYTSDKIWPRGLPLNLINQTFELEKSLTRQDCRIGVWQGLADEDPDVDAIYRLTNNALCYFSDRKPVVLAAGTICPFNTQNTMIRRELFALMYLPTYVTFRWTDILRGLVAQPIMWLYDYQLGFTNATVVQKRNPHDYVKDFLSEVPMYEYCEKVIELTDAAISGRQSIAANLFNAYSSLLKSNIVGKLEMNTLEAWLTDIANLKG